MDKNNWTLKQEKALRQYDTPLAFNDLILGLLGVGSKSMSEVDISSVVATGNSIEFTEGEKIRALPIRALQDLMRHPINIPEQHFTFQNIWQEAPSIDLEVPDSFYNPKTVLGHTPYLLEGSIDPKNEILNEVINLIMPIPSNRDTREEIGGIVENKSRITILLPTNNFSEDIDGKRNELTWKFHLLDLAKMEQDEIGITTLIRYLSVIQLLAPNGRSTRDSASLRDLLEITGWKSRFAQISDFKKKGLILDLEVIEELEAKLGCIDYENIEFFLGYTRRKSAVQESIVRINSEKWHWNDKHASKRDRLNIRWTLANLICHTGGVAVTILIPNRSRYAGTPMGTPTIFTSSTWAKALISTRSRITKAKKGDKIVCTVSDSLTSSKSIAHHFSDPNDNF